MILDYKDIDIKLLWATPNPKAILKLACDTTMKNFPELGSEVSTALIKYLICADHTKVFEHIVMAFQVTNMSRSLLQQNITHRTWSCTSSSQHYQDYSDMPLVIDIESWDVLERLTLEDAVEAYSARLNHGQTKEESRQGLPNACGVNQIITTNLRCLLNFFSLRCCNRNVPEMRIFAEKLRKMVRAYLPEFEMCVGPQCTQPGGCRQGKMRCKEKIWVQLC